MHPKFNQIFLSSRDSSQMNILYSKITSNSVSKVRRTFVSIAISMLNLFVLEDWVPFSKKQENHRIKNPSHKIRSKNHTIILMSSRLSLEHRKNTRTVILLGSTVRAFSVFVVQTIVKESQGSRSYAIKPRERKESSLNREG